MARDPRTFTPKKAAEAIGCSADTVRRYCALYGRHLSEGARPEAGATRVLTATDVYLLRLAKSQTEAGSSIEEIDRLLDTVALPPEVEVEPEEGERSNLPALASDVPEAVALLRQMASTLDRLEARDRRFDDFAGELADLRKLLDPRPEEPPAAPTGLTWSSPLVLVAVVAAAAVVVLTLAVVVALLR